MSDKLLAASVFNGTNYNEPPMLWRFNTLFDNIVSVVLALAGVVLFIMLLIGGWKFLTAGGDAKAAESAKHTITGAVTGLVLIASAVLILRFIYTITGVNVLVFNVYRP